MKRGFNYSLFSLFNFSAMCLEREWIYKFVVRETKTTPSTKKLPWVPPEAVDVEMGTRSCPSRDSDTIQEQQSSSSTVDSNKNNSTPARSPQTANVVNATATPDAANDIGQEDALDAHKDLTEKTNSLRASGH